MRHYWLTSDAPDLPANAFRRAYGLNRPATLEGGGGKGGGGSAPSYPDPMTVANATTQTNEQTAAYNKAINLNNYSNPFGAQQSYQSGIDPNTGAPVYSTQVSANPQLTSALNGLFGAASNSTPVLNSSIAGIGNINQSYGGLNAGLMGLAGQINPSAAQNAQQQGQNAAYAAQTQYLDPQFSQQKESLDAQLANQGITPGSQAYNNAMLNYNNTKQQAYSNAQNQSILTGSQIGTQNWQNQLAGVNTQAGLYGQTGQNLGQQAALFGQAAGLSQIPYSNLQSLAGLVPGYSGTSQSAASPADISGLYNNQYQSQLARYNAGQSSSNQLMGGLFGLGSSALLAYGMSDRRAKRNIKRIGTWGNGLGVYTYRYAWEKTGRHIGFMADEVRKIAPAAVKRFADGFDRVSYVLAVR